MLVPDALPGSAPEPPDDRNDDLDAPDREADRILAFEAIVRRTMRPPELTAAEIRRQQDRANAWHECPYSPGRLAFINELTTRFYEAKLPGTWAETYIAERLRQDITGDPGIRPGYAPAGWTTLVDHLAHQGVTDHEMLTAGVATTARDGRVIDRFRDRLVFPIVHDGQVLGFVGRCNPEHAHDGKHGPKYLNTADTPLFHKGDQLYVVGDPTARRAILVEGPIDAIAVRLATGGTRLGAAPLGTSLTHPQARQLAELDPRPIIATDADAAGQAAAERDYWLLTALSANPLAAHLPIDRDPADLLEIGRSADLARALEDAQPLGQQLLEGRMVSGSADNLIGAIRVLAAMPPSFWMTGIAEVADAIGMPEPVARIALASAVTAWNDNPERTSSFWCADRQHGADRRGPRRRHHGLDAPISPPTAQENPSIP